MRNLGLDVGDKRIGIAMSDPGEILASPLCTIVRNNDEQTLEQIAEIVKKNDIKKIIIGMPYSLSGHLNEQTSKVIDFKNKLSSRIGIIIEYQDERFTSVDAEKMMIQAGKKSEKRKQKLDSAAAALILQNYLDFRKQPGTEKEFLTTDLDRHIESNK